MNVLQMQRMVGEEWLDKLATAAVREESENYISEVRKEYKRMRDNGIDVIIPVYGNIEATEICIKSVLNRTFFPFRLVIINDKSPVSGMKEMLLQFSKDDRVVLLENEKNLGFPATVNKGFEYSARDVVILNNDAEVCYGWLENMVRAAAINLNAATVTPYSSNSGIFTLFSSDFTEQHDYLSLSRAVNQVFTGIYPLVPVGNGFCMLIRRKALQKVGYFDAEKFGRGYGEESDFCMRCRDQGYVHVVDTATYILHRHSLSFGAESGVLKKEHSLILEELHPEYPNLINQFKKDKIWANTKKQIKKLVREYLATVPVGELDIDKLCGSYCSKRRKRVLVVMHRGKGGSIQNRIDMMSGISDTCDSYLLTGDWKTLLLEVVTNGVRIPVKNYELKTPLDFRVFERKDIRAIYAEILFMYQIDYVNMSHLLGQTFDLVKECIHNNIPCIFVLHDYYTVCPNFKLLDTFNRYCGGICTTIGTQCQFSNWIGNLTTPISNMLSVWRLAMTEYLALFDMLCAPSSFCAEVIGNVYPELKDKIRVIEHGRDFGEDWRIPCSYPTREEKIRILIPGNIGNDKGMSFLLELLERDQGKNLELHIAGKVAKLLENKGLFLHGEYTRETLPELAREIRPHYGLVPSIYPETYCHTLSELWAMGLPTIVFAVGVPEARMKKSQAGWICSVGNVEEFYSLVTEKITYEEYMIKAKAAKDLAFPSIREMSNQYLDIFNAIDEHREKNIQVIFKDSKIQTDKNNATTCLDDNDREKHIWRTTLIQSTGILNRMCEENELPQQVYIKKLEKEKKVVEQKQNKTQRKLKQLERKIKQIESSKAFRIGNLLAWPIRKLRNFL